jgi:hypothetical protein
MAVTTTTLGGLLKRKYGSRVTQQQNKAAFFYKMLPKSIYKPTGVGFYAAVEVAGNQAGGGAINETEALHTAGNPTTVQFVIIPKIMSWVINISGLSRAVSEGNEASFATGLVRQFDEALENTIKDVNRQCYGNGMGTMAIKNGTSTSLTHAFDDVIYLKPGMIVDSYDSTGTTRGNNSATIVSVDRANKQATFDSSITLTDNDILVREEALASAPSDGKELAGTKLIVDDGTEATTFQGLSRTTYPILKGNIIDAGSVNLTNDLLQRAADEVSIVGDGKVDMLVSRHGQRRKYLDLCISDKRFMSGKLDRGYQTIEWNGLPWYIDVDCPTGEIQGYTSKYLERFEVRGIHLADDDGAVLKWGGSADTYTAYYRLYSNLGSLKPNAHFRLKNLNEPTGSN